MRLAFDCLTRSSSASIIFTWSVTVPPSVNLMALPVRFSKTWRRRTGSPTTYCGTSGAILAISLLRLASAWPVIKVQMPLTIRFRSKSICSRSILPSSIFSKSRMSLSKAIMASADSLMVEAYSFCSLPSDVSNSRRTMPNIPVMGVLIS